MRYTQKELVMKYINDFGSITPMQAFSDLGITKLATVVSRLIHDDGVEFVKSMQISRNRYGRSCTFMRYSFPTNVKTHTEVKTFGNE